MLGLGKQTDTPRLGADADVMARRLRDKLQTDDVIVCLKIRRMGDGGDDGMNVFKNRQMMARSVWKDSVSCTAVPAMT